MMGVIDQPGVGRHLAPGSPIKPGGAGGPGGPGGPGGARGREPVRAPMLGEHTTEILRTDLRLTEEQIRDLHQRGVVASASPER